MTFFFFLPNFVFLSIFFLFSQLNESKSYLAKSGVGMVPMRTSLGAGQTLVYTGPGGQNSVVTQPPSTVPRLAPSIVSLPVLAPVLKNASHQNTGPKVSFL